MTIEEAIRHAKVTAKLKYNEATMHRSNLDNEQCNNCVECAKEHEQLARWLEELKVYKEKATPEKPTYEGDGYAPDGTFVWDTWLCPGCGASYEVDVDKYDYCPRCGQKIEWENEIRWEQ